MNFSILNIVSNFFFVDMNNNNVSDPVVKSTSENISDLISTLQNKNVVIFCRVSSNMQTSPFSISFEVQENKALVCANMFKLKVIEIIKIVESAYDGKACTIKSLITKNKGKNIIIYNVSRFARNVDRGIELLNYALKCNTRLFFIEEGIVWDKNHLNCKEKLIKKLDFAQKESEAISRRVKDAKAEKKKRGYFTGGIAKYGYKIITEEFGKKCVKDENEQLVIRFINLCRTVGSTADSINFILKKISKYQNYPIILEFGNDVDCINEPMSYSCIANILNEYEVGRRGGQWTASNVSSANSVEKDDVENTENLFTNFKF